MAKSDANETKRRRYARLSAQLSKIGFVLQGTITERRIVRDTPNAAGGTTTYGPYYQWTWKQKHSHPIGGQYLFLADSKFFVFNGLAVLS